MPQQSQPRSAGGPQRDSRRIQPGSDAAKTVSDHIADVVQESATEDNPANNSGGRG